MFTISGKFDHITELVPTCASLQKLLTRPAASKRAILGSSRFHPERCRDVGELFYDPRPFDRRANLNNVRII
jgi:hypothetical protein